MSTKSKKHKKLEKTAYHEAGHAVAGYILKRRFSYVTIEPNEESLGHVIFQKFKDSFRPDYQEESKIRRPLEKIIMITLAGHAAEKIYTGRNYSAGSRSDSHDAIHLADYLCGSNEECEAFIAWLSVKIKNILSTNHNWCMVKALAEELLRYRKIGYKKARQIMIKAQSENYNNFFKNTNKMNLI